MQVIYLSLSTLLLLICMLLSVSALCVFLYSLILSLCLSLQRLCVEYKLHRERMSRWCVPPVYCDQCALLTCICSCLLSLATADQYS